MGLLLTPKYRFKAPIEGEEINPDNLSKLSLDEIKKLEVFEGNRKVRLEDLFKIETEKYPSTHDFTVRIVGDLNKVKRLGADMSMGELIIQGPSGMHLGEGMKGGSITVEGDSGSWTGCRMKGGLIEVLGDVGDYTGAAYRGSSEGMSGGEIIIHGDASNETGCYMRDGIIRIRGSVGQFTGTHMRGGTILVEGDSRGRDGAQMNKGKIIIKGYVPMVLPSFNVEGTRKKVKVGKGVVEGPFYLFGGDMTEGGAGRLYISKNKNPHFSGYERYLRGLPPKLSI